VTGNLFTENLPCIFGISYINANGDL